MTDFEIITMHLFCGFVAGGFSYAYFQGNWPALAERDRKKDFWLMGVGFIPLGLGGLIVAIFWSRFGKYGWWMWGRKDV